MKGELQCRESKTRSSQSGASRGIGEATALLLSERGAKLVLGARRADRLKTLVDHIASTGGQAAYSPTDVKRRDDLANLVKLTCERFGKLDVLVNNAGIAPTSLLDELRVQDWEEMIDVNIKGVLYGIAAACEKLRVTIISPGFVQTNLADSMTNPEVKARLPMQWTRWRSRRTRLPAPLRSRWNSRPMWMWAR